VVGNPRLLVYEGQLLSANLHAEGLTDQEVLQALREHGVDDLVGVKSVPYWRWTERLASCRGMRRAPAPGGGWVPCSAAGGQRGGLKQGRLSE
jgi:hypothetical protein